jgi:hypothetical protein
MHALGRGQKSLWSIGVSGDLPILTAIVENDADVEAAAEFIASHRLLYENGAAYDLVFLVRAAAITGISCATDFSTSCAVRTPRHAWLRAAESICATCRPTPPTRPRRIGHGRRIRQEI